MSKKVSCQTYFSLDPHLQPIRQILTPGSRTPAAPPLLRSTLRPVPSRPLTSHSLHLNFTTMGGLISRLFSGLRREARVCLLGLDGAGKTTMLYKLKLGESVRTIPTIGFNVETVKYKKLEMNMWDVGGQKKLRPLWHHYFTGCTGLIYVVDSADDERIEEAAEELHAVLNNELMRDVSVLVVANKQDLPQAVDCRDLVKGLGLDNLRTRDWRIEPCVATRGEGVWEGMDWLVDSLNKRV